MSHRNAPLSFEGRRRLVERCQSRPISHVAAEMGISRACASTWVNRYRRYGATGLHERSSVPHHSPQAASGEAVAAIEAWRREHTWSAARITAELAECGIVLDRRTVTRHLARLGLGRRRFIDPTGGTNRVPGRIVARWPGHMVHLDVKKVGRIPDGGGWRVHGRDSEVLVSGGQNAATSAEIPRCASGDSSRPARKNAACWNSAERPNRLWPARIVLSIRRETASACSWFS